MPTHLRKVNKDKSCISSRIWSKFIDVEYDRRNLKERGYNTPLILKNNI